MITKNIKLVLVSLFLISIMVTGVYATEITSEGNINTGDTTPVITFTPVGNNSSYVCTLWIDNAAKGVATVNNNTLGSITCNATLAKGSYTYNVSMYNFTESPATTYSSDATLKVSTFGGIVNMLRSVVDIFVPIVTIIVKVIPIFIVIVMAVFIVGLLTSLGNYIRGKL